MCEHKIPFNGGSSQSTVAGSLCDLLEDHFYISGKKKAAHIAGLRIYANLL
ncbi:uncharacterized protein PHALS_11171 [Plasmopara halstedii]|uniref:Uncharacterized protein n=1 Tax=Plasmopara halstedii TaxID=4781 RepID=A0A0P1AJJ2_PLAHL|nr:uncharacterized protein PHALS_11171 [Plasmopara halstedii]CEG41001.1 hypothetical protein PHALS_11171 [Plasmopara halstedii]|eukprot:XP_024577370.1 hypothetical protein PHALS_11171 [Plasmopara halstedii]